MAIRNLAGSAPIDGTILFRWGTDGVNYSSYASLTNANLSALVLDPNDLFYIDILINSTAFTVPEWIISRITFSGVIDPTATRHGVWDRYQMRKQFKEFLPFLIENHLVNTSYKVVNRPIRQCTPSKPLIFYTNVAPTRS